MSLLRQCHAHRLRRIEAFKKRMGWQFKWASSSGSDFNFDYGVSFTQRKLAGGKIYNFGTAGFPMEEAPGMSVFYKDASGEIFHTYSTYGRGLEDFLGVYVFSIACPRAATKKVWRIRWPGFGITTARCGEVCRTEINVTPDRN